MDIEQSRVVQTKPRMFKEYATLHLVRGDTVQAARGPVLTLTHPWTVQGKRPVLKNGTPRGPWLFVKHNEPYTVVESR